MVNIVVPLYFPHTCIREASIKVIHSYFGRFQILSPCSSSVPKNMEAAVQSNLIDVITPIVENDNKLISTVRMFQEWGALHQIRDVSFFKTVMNEIPNYDNASTTKIRSDLEKMMSSAGVKTSSSSKKPLSFEDFLWWARVFLQIAQELDSHLSEMDDVLSHVDQMEQALFKEIKGASEFGSEEAAVNSLSTTADESRSYNIDKRLAAWSAVFSRLESPTGVFITDQLQVVDYLEDLELISLKQIIPLDLLSGDGGPVTGKGNLLKNLIDDMSDVKEEKGHELKTMISSGDNRGEGPAFEIFDTKGVPPRRFFSRFLPGNIDVGKVFGIDDKLNNSVVCYLNCQ